MAFPIGSVGSGNISGRYEKFSSEDDAKGQEVSREKSSVADVCLCVRHVSLEPANPEADWFELGFGTAPEHEMLQKFSAWHASGYGDDRRLYDEKELKAFARSNGLENVEDIYNKLTYFFKFLIASGFSVKKKGKKTRHNEKGFFLPVESFNLWYAVLLYTNKQYEQSESLLHHSLSMVESETPTWFIKTTYTTLYMLYYKKGDYRQMMAYLKLAGKYDSAEGILTWAFVRAGLLDGCEELADPFLLVNLQHEACAFIRKGGMFRTTMDVGYAVGAVWTSVVDIVLAAGSTEEVLSAATGYIRWKSKRIEFAHENYDRLPGREKYLADFFLYERKRLLGIYKKIFLLEGEKKKSFYLASEQAYDEFIEAYKKNCYDKNYCVVCLNCFKSVTSYLLDNKILSDREVKVLDVTYSVLHAKDFERFFHVCACFFRTIREDARCIKKMFEMLDFSEQKKHSVESCASKDMLDEVWQCFKEPGRCEMPASLIKFVASSAGKDEWGRDFFRSLIGGDLPVDPRRSLLYARFIQHSDPVGFVLEAICHIVLRSPRDSIIEALSHGVNKGSAGAALMLGDLYAGKYTEYSDRELELAFEYYDMAGTMGLATGYIRAADLIIENSKGKNIFFKAAADLFRKAFQMLSVTFLTDEARYCTSMIDLCDEIVSEQESTEITSHVTPSAGVSFTDEPLSSEACLDRLVEPKNRSDLSIRSSLCGLDEVVEIKDDEFLLKSTGSVQVVKTEKSLLVNVAKSIDKKESTNRRWLFKRFRLINYYINEGEFSKAHECLEKMELKIPKADKYMRARLYDIWARFYKESMENIVPDSSFKKDKVFFANRRRELFAIGVSFVKKGLKEMSVIISDDMTLLNEDVFAKLSLSEKRVVASLCSLWGHLLSLQAQSIHSEKLKKLYEKIYRLAYNFNPNKEYRKAVLHEGKVRVIDEETFRKIYLALKE